jgi:hypothetical protein
MNELGRAGEDWRGRLTALIDRLPDGQEIEFDRILVRIEAPDRQALQDEIEAMGLRGKLRAVKRVYSPDTRAALFDLPLDRPLPLEVEDDWAGNTFRLVPERDVELIVSRVAQESR